MLKIVKLYTMTSADCDEKFSEKKVPVSSLSSPLSHGQMETPNHNRRVNKITARSAKFFPVQC